MSTGAFDPRATRLAALVRRTRRSLLATVLVAGFMLAMASVLAWVLGAAVLDLAMPLSVTGRWAAWCGWWMAAAAACGIFLLAPALRWPLLDAVALQIERVIGDRHNQLLTVVDLARRRAPAGSVPGPDGRDLRPEMVQRLIEQIHERAGGFRPGLLIPWRTLGRNLLVAASAVVCLAILSVAWGDRFRTTIERLLHPSADIPPATWLQLRSPGDLEVLEGDPLEIRGSIVRGSADAATLVIYDSSDRPSRQPMRPDGSGGFVAALDGLDRAVRYRLEAGNTWTKTHAIDILDRPEIRSLACRVRLPEYMRIDAPLAVATDASRIEAPEASTIDFELQSSSEAASGVLRLAERSLARDTVERFDDRVWFEDDLPRDAVSDTAWRWTTAHAAGGLRSFVCGSDSRPLVMRTRLEPLVMPRDQPQSRAFSLMARVDPADPPTRLTVLLEHGQGRTELVWGDAMTSQPRPGTTRVAAGALPQPGEWARLQVPMKSLGHTAGQAVTGVTFASDRGRVLLDRPGWMERSEEVVTRPVDAEIGEIPLVQSETGAYAAASHNLHPDDGTWTAGLPVATPVWVKAEFRTARGHASLPMPAIEIVPTVDKPPSIVVDSMPETLVLKAAHDVPLTGRGFDDWGIDEVCVLSGPDPARMEVRDLLPGVSPTLRPPVTQLTIATTLSAETLGLAAGKSVMWKLRIRDSKGQIVETKPFRISVLTPPENDLARTQVPALAQARREAEQLAREATKKAADADAKREAVRDALAADESPAKPMVDELTARLDRERRMADQVAKTAEKAAEQAARSELVPQRQKETLADVAAAARSLERRLAGDPAAKPAAGEPDAKTAADAGAKKDSTGTDVADTQPMKKADSRAERVAQSPLQSDVMKEADALADALEDVERRLDAQGAAMQIDALAKDLARRAERLADAGRPQADPEKTRQEIRDVERILDRKLPAATPDDGPAMNATAAADSDEESGTAPPTEPPSAGSPPISPRPAMATTAAAAAATAADSATQLAARLSDPSSQQTASEPSANASTSASSPSAKVATEGPTEERRDDELADLLRGEEVRQALAMAERARRLQAREAAIAEAAARAHAASGRDRAGRKPAASSPDGGDATTSSDAEASSGKAPSEGGAMAGSTTIDSADPLRGLDARQRAALYKLPPHVRDPLLDGMRQRGPAAYQGVIDSYFRQLGKDIPQ